MLRTSTTFAPQHQLAAIDRANLLCGKRIQHTLCDHGRKDDLRHSWSPVWTIKSPCQISDFKNIWINNTFHPSAVSNCKSIWVDIHLGVVLGTECWAWSVRPIDWGCRWPIEEVADACLQVEGKRLAFSLSLAELLAWLGVLQCWVLLVIGPVDSARGDMTLFFFAKTMPNKIKKCCKCSLLMWTIR